MTCFYYNLDGDQLHCYDCDCVIVWLAWLLVEHLMNLHGENALVKSDAFPREKQLSLH